tara:strand:+ start:250 stop:513 length:264 start_codon:yes stop_codon:yes gene_type:complete
MEERIKKKLEEELKPIRLDVMNESHKHAGHASSPGTGESHFNVIVVSEVFEGMSRVQRQRVVYRILDEEMKGDVHALSLLCAAPNEV